MEHEFKTIYNPQSWDSIKKIRKGEIPNSPKGIDDMWIIEHVETGIKYLIVGKCSGFGYGLGVCPLIEKSK